MVTYMKINDLMKCLDIVSMFSKDAVTGNQIIVDKHCK